MKTTEYRFHGKTYHLCLNGAALFDIYDRYGTKGFVTDVIKGNGKKSFQATCWFLQKLAEQGELVRRYQGYEHGKFPTAEYFAAMLRPLDVPAAKQAIAEAVAQGFARECSDDSGPVDEGLAELEKKTEGV